MPLQIGLVVQCVVEPLEVVWIFPCNQRHPAQHSAMDSQVPMPAPLIDQINGVVPCGGSPHSTRLNHSAPARDHRLWLDDLLDHRLSMSAPDQR